MQKRATALLQKKLSAGTNGQAEAPIQAQPEAPTVFLPEALVSITLKAILHGHEVMVTLRGVDFASVKGRSSKRPSGSRCKLLHSHSRRAQSTLKAGAASTASR